MRTRFILLACLGLAAGCGSSNATLSGTVAFSDASDASGITVSLVGSIAREVKTGAGGAYQFDKLENGSYLVSVEAKDTLEQRLSAALEVKGQTTAPTLTFDAVANLAGKVVDPTNTAAPGVEVRLAGSDRVTQSDANGSYAFLQVPAGAYTLFAVRASPPQTVNAAVPSIFRFGEAITAPATAWICRLRLVTERDVA